MTAVKSAISRSVERVARDPIIRLNVGLGLVISVTVKLMVCFAMIVRGIIELPLVTEANGNVEVWLSGDPLMRLVIFEVSLRTVYFIISPFSPCIPALVNR